MKTKTYVTFPDMDLDQRADDLIRHLENHVKSVQQTIADIRESKKGPKTIHMRWLLGIFFLHSKLVTYNMRRIDARKID